MPKDLALRVLKIISNPIRKTIIQSLEGTSMIFSDVMRVCGLDPNFDTGPFYYHLSMLVDAGLVEKVDSEYLLTNLGSTTSTLISTLQRESEFLLEPKPNSGKGGDTTMSRIEAKWLTQAEAQHGEYSILIGGPSRPPIKPELQTTPGDKDKHMKMLEWRDSLPKMEVPAEAIPYLSGYVLGFEQEGVKLGSIHIRLSTGNERGTKRVITLANIMSINILEQNCRKIGETRASVIRQMIEEFTKKAKEHHIQTIVVERVNADDEDLVNVLKEMDYERYMTTYLMRTMISN
jgi:hypothetical protein